MIFKRLCFFILISFAYSVDNNSKRILLNDQNYIDNNQIHKDIQNMKATLSQLQNKMVSQDQIINQQNAEIHSLKQQIVSSENYGVTYTRWGRKDCQKNGTQLVYSGMVVSGGSGDQGSPAQQVCAPHDPELGPDTAAPKFAAFYGTEYEDNYFGANLRNNDVPCAVCRAEKVTSIVMIPGREHCYNGWKMEFTGNLAGGHWNQSASANFVCLDSSPEVLEGGSADQGSSQLFPVKAWCGALKCPPYIQGGNIKCVVCVK